MNVLLLTWWNIDVDRFLASDVPLTATVVTLTATRDSGTCSEACAAGTSHLESTVYNKCAGASTMT